ncbi:hypothetical protein [Deinococcus sp. QL22]|nr:hypothetical protein [Deinococcus sp. QL22]
MATEARFKTAVWRDDKPAERAARIRLNDLNSQLLLIHTRVQVA